MSNIKIPACLALRHRMAGRLACLIFAVVLFASGCATKYTYIKHPEKVKKFSEIGMASWYGNKFAGRKTASGEIFDPNEMTAAHRSLPFDTVVNVTNLSNNESVEVRINDRGPFKRSRIIDLSKKAAQAIGMIKQGVAKVKIEYVKSEKMDGLKY